MTQQYIGCKQVQAWPAQKDGRDGYQLKYPDGYISWSPRETFEAAYVPMGFHLLPDYDSGARTENGDSVTQAMVDAFIREIEVSTVGVKTTLVRATLCNGFEIVTSSACVDPANYSEDIGRDCCLAKIKDHVWHLLGFALQWARYGLRS